VARAHLGIVRAFDPDRALGEIEIDGAQRISFHSTAIADGSRSIEVGAHVSVMVVPTHGGAIEAAEVIKVDRRA